MTFKSARFAQLAAENPPLLPKEITRCHNDTCDEKETCRRWLGRDKGGVNIPHAVFNKIAVEPCPKKINI